MAQVSVFVSPIKSAKFIKITTQLICICNLYQLFSRLTCDWENIRWRDRRKTSVFLGIQHSEPYWYMALHSFGLFVFFLVLYRCKEETNPHAIPFMLITNLIYRERLANSKNPNSWLPRYQVSSNLARVKKTGL